jgi:hypothetical protein
MAIYPFNELQIKYTLELSCIQISYLVINKGILNCRLALEPPHLL